MDSLTQIVLGAACGEVALGKKIGNKALLFGAIGGTIPDLDVIGNFVHSNEIDKLAFHRGFMHSIPFAFIAAVIIGFLVYKLYDSGRRKDTTNLKDWIWLFFLSILTHPILDSFTPYGTQLFLPFTDYRVAFNNISVADPLYTLPFLICLIGAMFFKRNNPKRIKWARAGIYISSAYMLFTLGNKIYVDSVWEKSLEEANIEYNRFSSQPTLLNNFLWHSVTETDSDYKLAYYSIFDETVPTFVSLPKNHDAVDINHPDLKILQWFSKGYFNLYEIDSTQQVIYNDLRYPLLNADDVNSSLFSFELVKDGDRWNAIPPERNFEELSLTDFFAGIFKRAFRDL